MGTSGHASETTRQGDVQQAYPTASSISEDIEQGSGGTHSEVTAERSGGTQQKSEKVPRME